MIAHDMFTIYLLGLATFPAFRTVVDAAVRAYRRRRPEPVLCAGCAGGWGVTVVTDPGQVAGVAVVQHADRHEHRVVGAGTPARAHGDQDGQPQPNPNPGEEGARANQ